jgi:CBS domain-containing protein
MGPYKITLKKIMSPTVITIDQESSTAEAISLMRSKHIRRLVVTKKVTDNGGRGGSSNNDHEYATGIVTLMSIIGNIPSNSIDLAELEVPSDIIEKENIIIVCPYCRSRFENNAEMSKHIDQIHIGSGLLEGDLRQ